MYQFPVKYLSHPLEQFEMFFFFIPNQVFGITALLLTNLMITLFFLETIFLFFINYSTGETKHIILSFIFYNLFSIVKTIIKSNITTQGAKFFPILFFLFLFICFSNIYGLTPYSLTNTSSFVITFFLACTYFIGIGILSLSTSKWYSFNHFLPEGVPLVIAPMLVIIELVSYFARIFSLSIRLFANMMAGHALLKILIGFAWILLISSNLFFILAILTWSLVTIIFCLEFVIAFLQSYVFTILVAIYLNEAYNIH